MRDLHTCIPACLHAVSMASPDSEAANCSVLHCRGHHPRSAAVGRRLVASCGCGGAHASMGRSCGVGAARCCCLTVALCMSRRLPAAGTISMRRQESPSNWVRQSARPCRWRVAHALHGMQLPQQRGASKGGFSERACQLPQPPAPIAPQQARAKSEELAAAAPVGNPSARCSNPRPLLDIRNHLAVLHAGRPMMNLTRARALATAPASDGSMGGNLLTLYVKSHVTLYL